MSDALAPPPASRGGWGTTISVVALSVALYASTVLNPLLLDSVPVALGNTPIRSLGDVVACFAGSSLPPSTDPLAAGQLAYYRPLSRLTYGLQQRAFGARPAGYHAVSVLLNALVGWLALVLAREVLASEPLAVWSAVLYVVSPARAEAVAWVYGQSEILAGLAVLAALLLHRRGHRVLGASAFGAGLLCRESVIVLPLIVIAHDILVDRGEKLRATVAPYLAVAGAYLLLRHAALGAAPPLTHVGVMAWCHTSAVVLARFVKIFLWPDGPVVFYPARLFDSLDTTVGLSYAGLTAAAALALHRRRGERVVGFWLVWSLAWLVPWLNVGEYGHFLMAEKGLYLAGLGLAAVLCRWLLAWPGGPVVLGVLIVAHAALVVQRVAYRSDPVTFFEAATKSAPELPQLRFELVKALRDAGRDPEADAVLGELVDGWPDFLPGRYARGLRLGALGRYAEATRDLERVVASAPAHAGALSNLGNCAYATGDVDRAERLWSQAWAADPGFAEAPYNLSLIAEHRGDDLAAIRLLRAYLRLAAEPVGSARQRLRRLTEMTPADTDEVHE